jgi:signal transduction histidine kinase
MSRDIASLEVNPLFLAEVLDGLYNCVAVSEPVRANGKITDFRCYFVNSAYADFFKLPREEIYRRSLLERYPGLSESGLFDKFVAVAETGAPMDIDHHLQSDGLNCQVRLVVKKFGDGILIIFHDIARRKRSETELRRVNVQLEERVTARTAELSQAQQRVEQALQTELQRSRAKGEFLAMVSHDLRSPLVAIQGYVGLLTSEGLNPEQVEQLNVIDHCAEALLRMLDDLLRFSRLESGQFKFETEPFILADLLDEVVDIFLPAARQKNLALRMEAGPALPQIVVGDPAQLRRVLSNLVGNALKYTEHGEVTVKVWTTPQYPPTEGWVLHGQVTDTGPGLDPAQVRRLFLPYEQGEGDGRRARGSVGLGLAICQRLCELMGGDVTYERAPGLGSRFSFRVKLGAVNLDAMDRE